MVFLSERDDSPVAPALSVSAAEGARRLLWARSVFVCASPLECADPKNAPVSAVQCAHTKTKDLKPRGMSSSKKTGVVVVSFPPSLPPLQQEPLP